MKNATKTTATKTNEVKTMSVLVDDKKKYIKFVLDDNRTLCIAFKNSKSLNCYFHKDFTKKFEKVESIRVKSNIETKADDFELQLLVKSADNVQSLKDIITKQLTTKTNVVEFKVPEVKE